MSELVLFSIEDGLATLTLNRPEKLNALSVASFRELDKHLNSITPERVGCVLLNAKGRSFCAGHDLDGIAGGFDFLASDHVWQVVLLTCDFSDGGFETSALWGARGKSANWLVVRGGNRGNSVHAHILTALRHNHGVRVWMGVGADELRQLTSVGSLTVADGFAVTPAWQQAMDEDELEVLEDEVRELCGTDRKSTRLNSSHT